MSTLLLSCLALPLGGALGLSLLPRARGEWLRLGALSVTLVTFLLSLLLWVGFDASTAAFQATARVSWLPGLHWTVGVDGLSLLFVVLTTFLLPSCILAGWTLPEARLKEYLVAFLVLEFCMLGVFVTLDLLVFYLFFEAVLLPMFLIIGLFGSRARKVQAAYQFFLYTLLGSVLLLLGILLLYLQTGTTDLQVLLQTSFSERRQVLLWAAFFASFAVKVPMVPVHIWLPEAHVEAPTAGSVILAGVLLKLGTYGFLRFSIPLLPQATLYFTPLVYTLSVVAILYTSLTTLRQVDLKKIIAYSSVAHMNYVTLGLFSLNLQGVAGSVMLMLSHGLVSPALFLCVGALYERHRTRLVKYYGGCVQAMPLFAFLFLSFTLANLSLPGTSSFVGEFLILVGTWQTHPGMATLAALGMVLGAAYSLWLYNRVVFGPTKPAYLPALCDLHRREVAMLLPFWGAVLWMGLAPQVFLDTVQASLCHLVQA